MFGRNNSGVLLFVTLFVNTFVFACYEKLCVDRRNLYRRAEEPKRFYLIKKLPYSNDYRDYENEFELKNGEETEMEDNEYEYKQLTGLQFYRCLYTNYAYRRMLLKGSDFETWKRGLNEYCNTELVSLDYFRQITRAVYFQHALLEFKSCMSVFPIIKQCIRNLFKSRVDLKRDHFEDRPSFKRTMKEYRNVKSCIVSSIKDTERITLIHTCIRTFNEETKNFEKEYKKIVTQLQKKIRAQSTAVKKPKYEE